MLGVDPAIDISTLRLWVAAGSAALLVVFFVVEFFRPQSRTATSAVLRAGSLLLAAGLGAAISWALLDHILLGDRVAERRAFELRADELSARALAPGSPLACLDAVAGENIEAACEKALFASPVSTAAASSYVAVRLGLFAAMASYVKRGGADMDDALLSLRRSLEADRFGFVAHVLAVRDGCTSQTCKTLTLLRDASHVRANLDAQIFDHYLDHYQELWAKTPEVADTTPAPSTTLQPNAQPPRRLVNIDFPTSASIPPISIMNPEPTGPVLPGVAAAAAANPNGTPAAASTRRVRKQVANPPAPAAPQPLPATAAATEPIWPEPLPPAPPSPQGAAAPTGAPVSLNPPAPSASVGTGVRAQ